MLFKCFMVSKGFDSYRCVYLTFDCSLSQVRVRPLDARKHRLPVGRHLAKENCTELFAQKWLCDMPEIGDVTSSNGFLPCFKALKVLVLDFDSSHHRRSFRSQNSTSEPLQEALLLTWKACSIKGGVPTTGSQLNRPES